MKNLLPLVLLGLLFFGCSGSKETEIKQEPPKEQVYVFDDESEQPITVNEVKEETPQNTVVIQEEPKTNLYYYVQVGAYNNRAGADKFIKENQKKIDYKLQVTFDQSKNLHVVQIKDPFGSKSDAQEVRDQLWQIKNFKDAWIREESK